MNIVAASKNDLRKISELANKIWWESYKGILLDEQIAFMLEQIYSEASIQNQVEAGSVFVFIQDEGESIGFASYELLRENTLRIHKLYLSKDTQGKGIGRKVLAHLEVVAKELDASVIELNVNRENPAYHFYLKQGFLVKEEVDIPYHHFVLNDYVMVKNLL
ncbi:MAG: GNAT family N-acetyltransferase [Proteobacteria bacterium]|nr:MAG: GNAT family N-acetyltransferase [Pseudomonadota bacterium]